jgi:pyruvate dehydrogenase E2 component (dihydrolipoamide acetyltransferase)
MSVSVSMPQLGESVTEGTVTRWLKREGEHVQADEPLLEVSTDKVDTEIPSPVSGVLRGITVAEDETVAVGAELAVIDEDGAAAQPAAAEPAQEAPAEAPAPAEPEPQASQQASEPAAYPPAAAEPAQAASYQQPAEPEPQEAPAPQPAAPEPAQAASYQQPAEPAQQAAQAPSYPAAASYEPAEAAGSYQEANANSDGSGASFGDGADGPYVTPLVRKLAADNGIDLAGVTGTGVGGRIRKQDILDAARAGRGPESAQGGTAAPAPPAAPAPAAAPQAVAPAPTAPPAAAPPAPAAIPAAAPSAPAPAAQEPAARRPAIVPSSLRGTTERMSRARQVIAQRMVESLQVSAQLTTVVEADVTAIARLRGRAKAAFEAREGVKLSFLPFFALATVEALKAHPKLNAVIDTASGQVTYHDAEHLGIAVDTERGLMVPVIRNAGDLNIGGLARKIADLANRTRGGQVSPDDLAGGTFTLTNTGSRGALFDTPIINQPQVGILGTGTVVKRAVVVEDPTLGEVITVRSMVYLALTYDHRLVDGADAARFLVALKARLEEGAFETELGL